MKGGWNLGEHIKTSVKENKMGKQSKGRPGGGVGGKW